MSEVGSPGDSPARAKVRPAEGVVVDERFRLVQMIGKGGMGSVWQAIHLGLATPCAVKFIEGELAEAADARARFEREARAAAQLRSPNVVQIFDHGVWEGHPYIAMELLEGEDLGKHLDRRGGRLPPAEVGFIVQQVCRALSRAHQAGVVHRDMKPDNIFIVPDDDRDIVKILDFGIAKSAGAALDGSNTKTGALLGTPYYMSPEQAQGTKTVDARSDLWSVAVIVFQCITGQLPFESEALGDLLLKIVVAPMPTPSSFFPSVPAGFDAWWSKAADRDPDKRFQTAKELAESLNVALGLSIASEGAEPRRLERAADRADVRPDVRGSATVLTPLGSEGAAKPSPRVPSTSSRTEPGVASRPTEVALDVIRVISGDDEVKALAEGVREGVGGALARNSALTVKTGDAAGADFRLKGSVQAVGKRLRLSFALEEEASGSQVWAERYDRQLDDVFTLQDEIAGYVATAIRNRIKLRLFESLRDADDATLALPQLLDKAAGFIQLVSLDALGRAVATLRVAVARAPDSSMACAMLSYALLESAEYDAMALAPEVAEEILTLADRGVTADPKSYVARTFKAIAVHDLRGNPSTVHELASEALSRNATFIKAQAMLAIADIHLGRVGAGVRRLDEVVTSGAVDPSHSRHRRELAIGHWLNGNAAEGMAVAAKLSQSAPEVRRNLVVLAGLAEAAGQHEEAARQIEALRRVAPGITLATARLPRIVDAAAAARFEALVVAAGLGADRG